MSSASEGEDLRERVSPAERVHLRERVRSVSEGEGLRKGPSEGEGLRKGPSEGEGEFGI